MANDYVVLGHTVAGGAITDGLKLDVETFEPSSDSPNEVATTLDGGSVLSLGVGKKVWAFDAMVFYGDQRSGYATLAIVRAWFEDMTAAGNLFKFQGLEDATIYDAILNNKARPDMKCKSATLFSNSSLWIVHFELRQI